MNIFLIILLVIAALVALVLIAAAFMSNEYVIEREVLVDSPRNSVFAYLKYLKNQDQYNKWTMIDLNSRKTYTGTDGTVGFVAAWDSDNKQAGKGEQEIVKIMEGERIDYELRFEKPFKNTSFASFITEPAGAQQTKVKWVFTGARNYMMKVFHLVFNLKKMLGNDMEISLGNLKRILAE